MAGGVVELVGETRAWIRFIRLHFTEKRLSCSPESCRYRVLCSAVETQEKEKRERKGKREKEKKSS